MTALAIDPSADPIKPTEPVPSPSSQITDAQAQKLVSIYTLRDEIVALKSRLAGVGMIPRRPAGMRERVATEIRETLKAKIEEHNKLVDELKATLPKPA